MSSNFLSFQYFSEIHLRNIYYAVFVHSILMVINFECTLSVFYFSYIVKNIIFQNDIILKSDVQRNEFPYYGIKKMEYCFESEDNEMIFVFLPKDFILLDILVLQIYNM